MSIWMGPLSYLYQAVTDIKNDLFARKALKIHQVGIPVLSIGNLTVGGTGKTPFVDYTIKYFVKRKKNVGVVSRAYKALAQNPVKVDIKRSNASRYFGDEPLWLAQKNTSASVFVGQSKWQIAKFAVDQEKMDLLIVDDGFQHRKLHRDLDILILDATENNDNYRLLPLGKAREKFDNINRADLIVISKCNWADEESLRLIRSRIASGKDVVEIGARIARFHNFNTGESLSLDQLSQKSAMLFCSIARPDVFEKICTDIFKETHILSFPDHYQFQMEDIESILRKKEKHRMDIICCTEKDAVKLAGLWPAGVDLWVSELEVDVLKNKERLYEIYNRFCP